MNKLTDEDIDTVYQHCKIFFDPQVSTGFMIQLIDRLREVERNCKEWQRLLDKCTNVGMTLIEQRCELERRLAVKVELPSKISEFNKTGNGFVLPEASNYDEAIDDCAKAIRAAGFQVKED